MLNRLLGMNAAETQVSASSHMLKVFHQKINQCTDARRYQLSRRIHSVHIEFDQFAGRQQRHQIAFLDTVANHKSRLQNDALMRQSGATAGVAVVGANFGVDFDARFAGGVLRVSTARAFQSDRRRPPQPDHRNVVCERQRGRQPVAKTVRRLQQRA